MGDCKLSREIYKHIDKYPMFKFLIMKENDSSDSGCYMIRKASNQKKLHVLTKQVQIHIFLIAMVGYYYCSPTYHDDHG